MEWDVQQPIASGKASSKGSTECRNSNAKHLSSENCWYHSGAIEYEGVGSICEKGFCRLMAEASRKACGACAKPCNTMFLDCQDEE